MFPKEGNKFPNTTTARNASVNYPQAIATALRAELGNSHQGAKTAVRWTGASERTVKNWFAGRKGPRGEHLISLIRHSNGVLEAVLRLADREQILSTKTLLDARNILVKMLASVDASILGQVKHP
jgi:hypothetical protein